MSAPRQHSHLLPDQGHAVRARGDIYVFKTRAAETEGHYSLFEARTLPDGGVPPHYHTRDEETFYVLEGQYEIQIGDETIVAGPGACLHVPRPLPHAFRNVGGGPARMLVVVSPGGLHEQYFDEAWEPIDDLEQVPPPPATPPDMARVAAALKRAGMEMLPEPGR